MDVQLIVNGAFGLISLLGGWVFKMLVGRIKDLEDDLEALEKHHENDLKETRRDLADLALSMPEKYVAKQDLEAAVPAPA